MGKNLIEVVKSWNWHKIPTVVGSYKRNLQCSSPLPLDLKNMTRKMSLLVVYCCRPAPFSREKVYSGASCKFLTGVFQRPCPDPPRAFLLILILCLPLCLDHDVILCSICQRTRHTGTETWKCLASSYIIGQPKTPLLQWSIQVPTNDRWAPYVSVCHWLKSAQNWLRNVRICFLEAEDFNIVGTHKNIIALTLGENWNITPTSSFQAHHIKTVTYRKHKL